MLSLIIAIIYVRRFHNILVLENGNGSEIFLTYTRQILCNYFLNYSKHEKEEYYLLTFLPLS